MNRIITSSKSTTTSPGPTASAPKTAKKEALAGAPPRKIKLSNITISVPSGKPCVVCLAQEAWYLRSERISCLSPRLWKSRMCRGGLRVRLGAGAMILVGIRGRRGIRRCCWSIWIGSMRSRLRRGWIWGWRMGLGLIPFDDLRCFLPGSRKKSGIA